MSTYRTEGQLNPDVPVEAAPETPVDRVVRSLEDNKAAVGRWFWKALFAFNLVLGSAVFWVAVLRHVW